MLIKIFGIIDLIAVGVILFHATLPTTWITIIALTLFFKGGLYGLMGDLASYADLLCSAYLFTLQYGDGISILSGICGLFLLQKGLLSVFV